MLKGESRWPFGTLLTHLPTKKKRRLLADPVLGHFFEAETLPKHEAIVSRFLIGAMGGPNEYKGRNMVDAHIGLLDLKYPEVRKRERDRKRERNGEEKRREREEVLRKNERKEKTLTFQKKNFSPALQHRRRSPPIGARRARRPASGD